MSFFKRLFSSGKENDDKKNKPADPKPAVSSVYTDAYFNTRYTEQKLSENQLLLDGCIKMLESYFLETSLTRKIPEPICHPENLDQAVNEGMGFYPYCKSFNLEDPQIVFFLAYAFTSFMTEHVGFTLYKDSTPDSKLRDLTLKINKNGVVMSLYPMEYAFKVLNGDAIFNSLYQKIEAQLNTMPSAKDLLGE